MTVAQLDSLITLLRSRPAPAVQDVAQARARFEKMGELLGRPADAKCEPVKAGSVLGAPAGGQDTAHQIINTGTVPLRYYGISTMSIADVCEYPDSGKFGVFSRSTRNPYDKSTIRHLQHLDHAGVDYWDGEPGSEEGTTK